MHKGRAVRNAGDEAVFGRLAGVAELTGHLHPAHTFPAISSVHARAIAKIDKISEPIPEPWMPRNPRESDSPARTRGIPFLAA